MIRAGHGRHVTCDDPNLASVRQLWTGFKRRMAAVHLTAWRTPEEVFVRQPDKQKRSRRLGCVDTLISQSRVAVAKEGKGVWNSL